MLLGRKTTTNKQTTLLNGWFIPRNGTGRRTATLAAHLSHYWSSDGMKPGFTSSISICVCARGCMQGESLDWTRRECESMLHVAGQAWYEGG